jgi:hypothetical protein
MGAALLASWCTISRALPFGEDRSGSLFSTIRRVRVVVKTDDFYGALAKYDSSEMITEGPTGCDSDKSVAARNQVSLKFSD